MPTNAYYGTGVYGDSYYGEAFWPALLGAISALSSVSGGLSNPQITGGISALSVISGSLYIPEVAISSALQQDADLDFIESSPPGLLPDNDDSYFGTVIRKAWIDRIAELIGQLDTIYDERFVSTSTKFLDEWEIQQGVPVAPSGATITQRRTVVLSRVRKGPLTRTRRKDVVESFILAAGETTAFGKYSITEGISTFTYTVEILNTVSVDTVALERELTRITPAHLSFSVILVASLSDSVYGYGDYGSGNYGTA